MIVIIDYGLGNVCSIKNMIRKIGYQSVISSDKEVIKNASKIILPGVGAFDEGIKNIDLLGLRDIIVHKTIVEQTPIMGICLGMQLMVNSSEEGVLKGLSLIEGEAKKFPPLIKRIPHIGWNLVKSNPENKLSQHFTKDNRFYFVHSYYVELQDKSHVLFYSNYGIDFISAFSVNNIFGVQFHPEKSHRYGKYLLNYFIEKF